MSSIQGYPSQEKLVNPLDGYNELQSKTSAQFVTLSETFDKKVTVDTKIHGEFRTSALPKVIASVATDYPLRVLKITGHGAIKGDSIRFEGTSANPYFSAKVINVPDANTLIIGSTLPVAPLVNDELFVLKSIIPLYDEDGALQVSQGPIEFILDGLPAQVIEDTVTPANNRPLPVKLTSITGDINITAQDLNVQLSHIGVNADSTRIGDGSTLLGITLSNEAKTFDATTHTELIDVNAELDAITAVSSLIEASNASILIETQNINTELDAQTALLTTIDADTGSIAISSSAINTKLPTTIGQKTAANSLAVVLASDQTLPLPSGAATEATLATRASETTLAAINTKVATETTLAAINTKVATETTLAAVDVKLGAIQTATELIDDTIATDGGAALTKFQTVGGHNGTTARAWHVNAAGEGKVTAAQLPASLGQAAMAASLPVVIASNQSAINVRSGLVPREFDQIDLTYVPSGNGAGEVQTAVYKLATVTQATLTLSYDSSNRVTSVVRT